MKKTNLHILLRILYYSLSLIILGYALYNISNGDLALYIDDYIFLFILCISFILVNKYSIRLRDTKLIFNDFIILIVYIKFGISISIILLFFCYILILGIEYKDSKKLNLLMENIYIFNNCLFILSTYSSHLIFMFLNNIFAIKNYQLMFIVVFGFIFLLCNYILLCMDLSFQKNALILITLENGLYYVILNFFLCTIIASLAIYLYNFYGYVPVIVMTCFIIFTSFAANSLDRLKTTNNNIKVIANCTTFVISNVDFKTKLQHVLEVIEGIIPFVFCGVYMFRENYESIYPISYKSTYLVDFEDLKFIQSSDNEIIRRIQLGNPLYNENIHLKNNITLMATLENEIKYNVIIPVKQSNTTIGFILICIDRHNEYKEEMELLSTLGEHIGMVNFHMNTNIKNNIIIHKNHDALTKYIDYNISLKIFFTLAIIEVINFNEIINNYNSDFYLTYRNELTRLISNHLSPNDYILCFEKEDIYIIFNLLDSRNSLKKLEEIKISLKTFNFKDIISETKICYSICEYPIEGTNSDEILAKIYRKLYKEKNA